MSLILAFGRAVAASPSLFIRDSNGNDDTYIVLRSGSTATTTINSMISSTWSGLNSVFM